jgi:tetratricopeptide (TPR) repeat protein
MSEEILRQIERLNAEAEVARSRGRGDDALQATRKAYAMGREARLDRSATFVTTLNNLGVLQQDLGDYSAARPLFEEAVDTLRGTLRSDHPEAAEILHNLGNLFQSQAEYAAAEPLLVEAAHVARRVPGPTHTDTATILHNLAVLYSSMCRYAEAEPLHRQGIEIRRVALGEQHRAYATSLQNLAWLHGLQGRPDPYYWGAFILQRDAANPLTLSIESPR